MDPGNLKDRESVPSGGGGLLGRGGKGGVLRVGVPRAEFVLTCKPNTHHKGGGGNLYPSSVVS